MSEQVRQKYGKRAREFAARQGWVPPVRAMTQVWISVHDDYPVYCLDAAPPPGMRLSNLRVPVSEQTAQRWQEAAQAYRRVQDEMAEAYQEAQGSVQPD